ncbi:PREDICTED: phosphatidylserine synthase 1-like isoform X2 [Priapulus caudatus]|uniref:Phosphatidylserine synthase n=1 Tax=Priapulus caudatus TaxID=37621 RepID=A0ABM1E9B7_PRICU|nr:PREDICTED: phosphatidylserine synthase 1-like isoform X2 [Priapulus caudatus]
MAQRIRTYSMSSEASNHFHSINEHPVDDISLEFFYKPHTVTLLTVSILGLLYSVFTRDDNVAEENLISGLCAVVFFFLIVSVLTFPNGISVLYLLLLQFILFQNLSDVRNMMWWLFPDLRHFRIDTEKDYAVNCSDVTFERVWSHVDVFAFGHFWGWALKALLIRHAGICWTISFMWEFTEMFFAHLLPNFKECWWDALILDVLICNGLGIWLGMFVCKKLEIRTFSWESIKDIHSATGKLKRAVLQFTPESWTHVRWLDPNCTYMRFWALCQLVIIWQIAELNTFFLKHILEVPTGHPLSVGRILLIAAISAPSLRQYYTYVTDPHCSRVGTQCWVFCAVTLTEALICVKLGADLFALTEATSIVGWLLFMMALSVICVYLCVEYARWQNARLRQADERAEAAARESSPKKSRSLNFVQEYVDSNPVENGEQGSPGKVKRRSKAAKGKTGT